jgi:hypothetical protein
MLYLILIYLVIGFLVALSNDEITGMNLASASAAVKAPVKLAKSYYSKLGSF